MLAAGAEFLILHHGDDSCLCVFSGLCDDNAFAQCQAVCLDNGRDRSSLQICQRFFHIIKGLVACGRNAVFLHQIFGKDFAAFDDGCIGPRAETRNADRLERIHASEYQWIIRCDDSIVDLFFAGKLCDAVDVFRVDRDALCVTRDAAVSRNGKDFRDLRVFFDLLDNGVFAAAAAND